MKYYNAMVVFEEIPNEITLAINITNCPCLKYGLKLKVGWYSGRDNISQFVDLAHFDYVKIGHYDEERGSLDKETTNQILYKVCREGDKQWVEDITHMFWKKGKE